MKKISSLQVCLCVLIIFLCLGVNAQQNTGFGGPPDATAKVDIQSTTQGILIPRMSTTDREHIVSPADGLQIFNTTTKCFEFYLGGAWQPSSCGCTNAPDAAGAISGTATVCLGQSGVLYALPAIPGATSYTWTYSGTGVTLSGATNPVVINFAADATSGDLTVQGTNACGNGTVSASYSILVGPAPSVTGQPGSPAAVCAGTGNPSFTVTATTPVGNLNYQWQEYTTSWNNLSDGGVYSGVTTHTLTITTPGADMNGYQYRCVVSGICTSITTDGTATLTVNPIPTLSSSLTPPAICSGSAFSYTPESTTLGATFVWGRYTASGITPDGTSGSDNPNEILTNTTSAPIDVAYLFEVSAAGCTNASDYNIMVTVKPTPSVTNNPLAQSISTGGNTTLVTLTSDVNGTTFDWTAAAQSGDLTGYESSGTSEIPVQTITNSGTGTETVTYAVTPTADGCVGEVTNYVVSVNLGPLFSDDFHRADGAVGNGWTSVLQGSGDAIGISNNSFYDVGHWDGQHWISRSDIHPSGGYSIYTEFYSAQLIYGRDGDDLYIGALGDNGGHGYRVLIDGGGVGDYGGNIQLIDNGPPLLASANFDFGSNYLTDTYAVEVDYYGAPTNWVDVYLWDKNTDSKPSTPTMSFNNGGSNYTPNSTGSSFFMGWSHNGVGNDVTSYTYLFQVSNFP